MFKNLKPGHIGVVTADFNKGDSKIQKRGSLQSRDWFFCTSSPYKLFLALIELATCGSGKTKRKLVQPAKPTSSSWMAKLSLCIGSKGTGTSWQIPQTMQNFAEPWISTQTGVHQLNNFRIRNSQDHTLPAGSLAICVERSHLHCQATK